MKNKGKAAAISVVLLLFAGFLIFVLNMPLSMQLAVCQLNGEVIYENRYHESGTMLILYDARKNCVSFLDVRTTAPFGTRKIQAYSVFDLESRSEARSGGFYDTIGHGDSRIYRYACETGWDGNLCAIGIYVPGIENGVSYLNTLMFGVSVAEKGDCLFQESFGDVFVFAEMRTS